MAICQVARYISALLSVPEESVYQPESEKQFMFRQATDEVDKGISSNFLMIVPFHVLLLSLW